MTPRWISSAVFGLALLCFFLPFVSVSCGGGKVMTLSGADLVVGRAADRNDKKIDPEPMAIFCVIAGAAGLIASCRKGQPASTAAAALGGLAAVLLLLLKEKLNDEVRRKGDGVIRLEFEPGYWLSLGGYLGAAITSFAASASARREQGDQAALSPPPPPPPVADG